MPCFSRGASVTANIFITLQAEIVFKMPTYNIIGDIHGRTNWKELVDEDCINIFVGDYFDPYTEILFEDLERNFLEIIDLKKRMPDNVVLLYGNHDYEYLPGIFERSNRYDAFNARKIMALLTENEAQFYGVAYAIGNTCLVTHAGVTKPWVMNHLPEAARLLPRKMEEAINTLWINDKKAFGFDGNADPFDYHGESKGHSPLWVRPRSFFENNIYKNRKNVVQVVGHSKVRAVAQEGNIIFVDCLGSVTESKRVSLE